MFNCIHGLDDPYAVRSAAEIDDLAGVPARIRIDARGRIVGVDLAGDDPEDAIRQHRK